MMAPLRLNATARYPSSLSSYSHCSPAEGRESGRNSSIGSTNRAEVVFDFGADDLAVVLLFVRPMRNQITNDTDQPALQRDPDEWKTGDEPMTDAQRSYLETLCRETGEAFDETLSKADASKRIDELRERSPRLAQE
jgi:hypothetical protein